MMKPIRDNLTIEKLDASFYDRPDVVRIARDLLGKVLVTEIDGQRTSGRIVEVEAYNGVIDRASHAWSGRRTRRTEVMFGQGGVAYVYLIYGIYHLFNVVTNSKEVPHAVLVRALEPMDGIPVMLRRTGKHHPDHTLTRGPGNLSKAMGLLTKYTGVSLLGDEIYIGDDGWRPRRGEIVASPRIGVDYAGEDAKLLYRFYVKGNPYVSGPKEKVLKGRAAGGKVTGKVRKPGETEGKIGKVQSMEGMVDKGKVTVGKPVKDKAPGKKKR